MYIEPESEPGLQEVLAQLARFFRANESRISAEQVSKCFQHLSATEKSALNRLFVILYRRKSETPELESGPKRGGHGISRAGRTVYPNQRGPNIDKSGKTLSWHNDQQRSPRGDGLSRPSLLYQRQQQQQHGLSPPSTSGNGHSQSTLHRSTRSSQITLPTSEDLDFTTNQSTFRSGSGEVVTAFQQLSPTVAPALSEVETAALHQTETTPLDIGVDDDAVSKTSLAMCSEIDFAPSTKRLLEDCKSNCGKFLRVIKEAKAVFPNGQGWEAAIATKKENTNIRDLMRIYHRFECYNIYRHVVDARFHTGTHWIREMRTILVNKLCQDFPERFQNQKVANKCLNWVDQGCRYHEWAEMLSKTSDLGYLIALPSDVSHSAYTSRCTKEQMTAAVVKFKSLGIEKIVKNLELSELGNYIAVKLREMTGKKRKEVDELVQAPANRRD